MRLLLVASAMLFISFLSSCKDDPIPIPPSTTGFSLFVRNDFGPLDSHYAIYLSDSQGQVRAYREAPEQDTIQIEVPEAAADARFDCTVVKITASEIPGSGIRDTTIQLTTYTGLASGEHIYLRDLSYHQVTDLYVSFSGMTTFDSIIVPDGLTFVRPQASNNYTGQYRVLHTGRIWLRVLADKDPHWRYLSFENVNAPTLIAPVNVSLLPLTFVPPTPINLPFSAAWQYKVEGLIDTAKQQFLPMGDLLRAPGGAVPVFNTIHVFEPVVTDDFGPSPRPYKGFRLRTSGEDGSPASDGYTYESDHLYAKLPATLPIPDFDLIPTILSDKSLVAVQCLGQFDVLVLTRERAGTPNIKWEVFTKPAAGIVSYSLPKVPSVLGQQFPALKNYDFGDLVRVRAERYERLTGYDAVIHRRLLNADPLWQAKAGYLGREEVY